MPLDPFFTSAAKDEEQIKRERRRANAKAYQARMFLTGPANAKARKTFWKHQGGSGHIDAACITIKNTARHGSIVTPANVGRSALVGFKKPRRQYIHRNSQNPDAKTKDIAHIQYEQHRKNTRKRHNRESQRRRRQLAQGITPAPRLYES